MEDFTQPVPNTLIFKIFNTLVSDFTNFAKIKMIPIFDGDGHKMGEKILLRILVIIGQKVQNDLHHHKIVAKYFETGSNIST